MTAIDYLWKHRTKVLGFVQITIGAMALWTFIPPTVATYLTAANGLLTVWVGFVNSAVAAIATKASDDPTPSE